MRITTTCLALHSTPPEASSPDAYVDYAIEEILPAFDHTLVIKSGRVLASGKTSEVLTRPVFESLYDTRLTRLERSGGRAWPIWGDPTEAPR